MAERIAKGIIIKPDGAITKHGDSWVVVIPPSYIRDKEIKKATPCKIYRNLEDHLIIEVVDNGKPRKRRP